jgi:excisionase family DNA binding protein
MEKVGLLSADQVAAELGVSHWIIRKWARERKLASFKLGKRRLFDRRDIEVFLQQRRCLATPAGAGDHHAA